MNRCTTIFVFAICGWPASILAQEAVIDFVQRESDWTELIRSKQPITLSGRYEGRVAERFRLAELPIRMLPQRTARLPQGISAGQRLQVTGVLKKTGSRYMMDVSGIAIGKTDEERFRIQFEALDQADFSAGYQLASEAQVIADFYKDRQLKSQIKLMKQTVFRRQRTAANSIQDLEETLAAADSVGVSADVVQAIQFQVLTLLVKQRPVPEAEILKRLKAHFPSWDQASLLPENVARQFKTDPVTTYESANAKIRKTLHRHLYRSVIVPQILQQLKKDNSNANKIAAELRTRFPELQVQATELEADYLAWRLTQVDQLNRQQMEDLIALLTKASRTADIASVVGQWLKQQEKERNTGGIAGKLATADNYLYAVDRWKQPQHLDRGTGLLKQVWQELHNSQAVEEAQTIEQRLEALGWVRLRDRWLTSEQVSRLPDDDVDLAMKQGRVVAGMTAQQVLRLGQPSRRTRIYSATTVREVWTYDEAGSTTLIVHLSRSITAKPEAAIATYVGKSR